MEELDKMKICIVDDEDTVLSSISNLLVLETDCKVQSFKSPLDALKEIQNDNVDMVISDYMMPEMNGLKFLSNVKEMNPDIIRIILTGYADKKNAIKSINDVGLYHYIEKPWDNSDLLLIIRNGLERRYLIKSLKEKMDELCETVSDLHEVRSKMLQVLI